MTRNLYEALGVDSTATAEFIRKAYRKKALETHPDKLPPGSTEADREIATERFHLVSNAYEVLSDPEKRSIYDRHGEFPPPEVQEPYADRHHRHGHHTYHSHSHPYRGANFSDDMQSPFEHPFFSHSFSTPFMRSPRARAHPHSFSGFTDPFALFDQIFGDMTRHFDDPFFSDTQAHPSRQFMQRNSFGPSGHASIFDGMLMNPAFGMLPPTTSFARLEGPRYGQSSSFGLSSGGVYPNDSGRWVSQSRMTRTVNGITESVWKRTDSAGNEHTTYSYPDGSERYIVNGVEQPLLQRDQEQQSLPPPPPYSTGTQVPIDYRTNRPDTQQVAALHDSKRDSRSKRSHHRPRDHHDSECDYTESQRSHVAHRRPHEPQQEHYENQDHEKKRWWRGQ